MKKILVVVKIMGLYLFSLFFFVILGKFYCKEKSGMFIDSVKHELYYAILTPRSGESASLAGLPRDGPTPT